MAEEVSGSFSLSADILRVGVTPQTQPTADAVIGPVASVAQFAIEVAAQPDNASASVAQFATEVVIEPDTASASVAQFAIEVLLYTRGFTLDAYIPTYQFTLTADAEISAAAPHVFWADAWFANLIEGTPFTLDATIQIEVATGAFWANALVGGAIVADADLFKRRTVTEWTDVLGGSSISPYGNLPPSNAQNLHDGDVGTVSGIGAAVRAAGLYSTGWVVDLGSSRSIRKMLLRTTNLDDHNDHVIEYSDDNSSWFTASTAYRDHTDDGWWWDVSPWRFGNTLAVDILDGTAHRYWRITRWHNHLGGYMGDYYHAEWAFFDWAPRAVAVIQKERYGSFWFDALISTDGWAFNAVLQKEQPGSFAAESEFVAQHFESDAVVIGELSFSKPADAWFVVQRTGAATADADVVLGFKANALLVKDKSLVFRADAVRKFSAPDGSLTADAFFILRIRANAVVYAAMPTKTFTAIGILRVHPTGSFVVDAVLQGRIRANAVLLGPKSGSRTADAEILPRRWNADASIVRNYAKTFTADALRRIRPTYSLVANAYIYAAGKFSTYADILRTQSGGFTADILTSYPFFRVDALLMRVQYSDKTHDWSTDQNILVVTGGNETVLPGCVINIYRSTVASMSWDVWVSQNKNDPYHDPVKQVRIRLRRTSVTGAILWEYTLPDDTGNFVNGLRQQVTGSYDDPSPTDGIYVLTAEEVAGNSLTEVWSGHREFSASGVFAHADAVFDGWYGAHISQRAQEVLVGRTDTEIRVSQHAIEALVKHYAVDTYVSQNVIEVLKGQGVTLPDIYVTQRVVEVLGPAWKYRFQLFAVMSVPIVFSFGSAALVLSHMPASMTADAVIFPKHTKADSVAAVEVAHIPSAEGDFYGLAYLWRGIIEFSFRIDEGASNVVRWHGGTVSTSDVGNHWEARVTDVLGNSFLVLPFFPDYGETWTARFSVDAGLGRKVYGKVWRDEEPGWQVEATAPNAPALWYAYGTATNVTELREWTILSPWRFDDAFTLDAIVGRCGFFSATAAILGPRPKSTTANAVKAKTVPGSKTVDAVIDRRYTFAADAITRWNLPPDTYRWSRFYAGANIQRGFYANASFRPAFVSDAILGPLPSAPTFTIDSRIHRPVGSDMPGTFTLDFKVAIHPVGTFVLKAWKEPGAYMPTTGGSFYSYAYISGGRKFLLDARIAVLTYPEAAFTADAETSQTYRTTVALADAVIKRQGGWHLWCDAWLKAEAPPPSIFGSGSWSADAFLSLSFYADAVVYRAPTFSVDAYFSGTISYFFTASAEVDNTKRLVADAVIYQPTAMVEPLWMSGYILCPMFAAFPADAFFAHGFRVDAAVISPRASSFTVGSFFYGGPAKWLEPDPDHPGQVVWRGPNAGTFDPGRYLRNITISVGGTDISRDVMWAETSFTSRAKAGSGNFYITVKGGKTFAYGSIVTLDVDGRRTFGGILTRLTSSYFQPDVKTDDQKKTVLEGPDFNYILDRLIVHNEIIDTGTEGADEYIPIPAYPVGTTDAEIIEDVFDKYITNKPEWFHIGGIGTSNIVAIENPYKLGDPGSTLRALLTELTRLTDGIFWVDPFGGLWYTLRSFWAAPYSLSRGGEGGVGTRSLTVTSDVSNSLQTVIVWGDIEDPKNASEKKVDPGRIYAKRADGGLAIWSQYGEYDVTTIRRTGHVDRRAQALIDRKSRIFWTAQGRVFEPGFGAGQNVEVEGAADTLIIKQITVGFISAAPMVGNQARGIVFYDLSLGIEPEDPWTYYDALTFNEKTSSHPGGTGGHPTYEVAIPYFHGRPAHFVMPCIIDGHDLPVGHLETFTSDGGYWGDYKASEVDPKRVWYDVGLENISSLNLDLSLVRAWIDDGVGYLTNLLPGNLGMSDLRLRLGPAWDTGMFPTCQVWLISSNPSGRRFFISSFGAWVEWSGHTLTLDAVAARGAAKTYDMGRDPEPCWVRFWMSETGIAANVWSIDEEEPDKWMLQLATKHGWLEGPHVLLQLFIFGTLYRVWMDDWTEARNLASVIGIGRPGTAGTPADAEPIGVSSMVIEHGAGMTLLVGGESGEPYSDITEQPWRSSVHYSYDRPMENCWWRTWYPIEHQDASYGVGTIGHGDFNEETWLFGWWWAYHDYFEEPGGYRPSVGHVYDPYIRADDGWWVWWSPCIFGGYADAGDQPYGGTNTHYNQKGPHKMWKDSTFITIPLPSKYVNGFVFHLKLGLRTHQDFSMILGNPEGPYIAYEVGLWVWESDEQAVTKDDIDPVTGLPWPHLRKTVWRGWVQAPTWTLDDREIGVNGKDADGFPAGVKVLLEPDYRKRKRFFRYGLEWLSDTQTAAEKFGPRGGPLFGPPWVRAVVMPCERYIYMTWDATQPEKGIDGIELTPESTMLFADSTYDMVPVEGGGSAKQYFSPNHGWVEETIPLKSGKTTKMVQVEVPATLGAMGVPAPGTMTKVWREVQTKRRMFRLSRGATPGTINVFANGKKLIYGTVDPDEWNRTHPKDQWVHNDYWLLTEEDGPWNDEGTKNPDGTQKSPSEPRTYAVRKSLHATAVTARYLVVEYLQPRSDQQHRQREHTVTNADRAKRGMIQPT